MKAKRSLPLILFAVFFALFTGEAFASGKKRVEVDLPDRLQLCGSCSGQVGVEARYWIDSFEASLSKQQRLPTESNRYFYTWIPKEESYYDELSQNVIRELYGDLVQLSGLLEENKEKFLLSLLEKNRLNRSQIQTRLVFQFSKQVTDRRKSIIERLAQEPYDFFGYVHSKEAHSPSTGEKHRQASVHLNGYQSRLSANSTLVHELFHLFDPYQGRTSPNQAGPSPMLIEVGREFRAYLLELSLFEPLQRLHAEQWYQELDHKGFKNLHRLKKKKDQGPFYRELFSYVLERLHPVTHMPEWTLTSQSRIERLHSKNYQNNVSIHYPFPPQSQHQGYTVSYLGKLLAPHLTDHSEELLLRVNYRNDIHERQSQYLASMLAQKQIVAELYRQYGPAKNLDQVISRWIADQRITDFTEPLTEEINLLTSGGPKGRDSGD